MKVTSSLSIPSILLPPPRNAFRSVPIASPPDVVPVSVPVPARPRSEPKPEPCPPAAT